MARFCHLCSSELYDWLRDRTRAWEMAAEAEIRQPGPDATNCPACHSVIEPSVTTVILQA